MKLLLIAIISSFVLTIAVNIAHAQNDVSPRSEREAIRLERLETRQERIATRSADLKRKLGNFRNRNKAVIVERLSTNLNNVNDNRTSAMLRHIDKMATISARLTDRVGGVTGQDTSAADAAVLKANNSIATAKNAVEEQALKDYTITISSESAAKAEISATRQTLFADLKAVHDLVIEARKTLADAIMEASKLSNQGGMNGVQ